MAPQRTAGVTVLPAEPADKLLLGKGAMLGKDSPAMNEFIPAIGESDFRFLREADCGYIDKSSIISEIVADPTLVLIFPRPRRFGKTLTLSMLRHFSRLPSYSQTQFHRLHQEQMIVVCNDVAIFDFALGQTGGRQAEGWRKVDSARS